MPNQALADEFRRCQDDWNAMGESLAALTEQMAIETVAEVLPSATVIETRGEFTEDWIRVLRIQRVCSAAGDVLYDVARGHERRVEDAVDRVNENYLDLLLDLTGDYFMGHGAIDVAPVGM